MIRIEPVRAGALDDFDAYFQGDPATNGCWCTWFILPYKEYKANGPEGNRAQIHALAQSSDLPLGLLAYEDDHSLGWCALGPRGRYARAILTPTYKGRNPTEDLQVWLIPCFSVRPDQRGAGIATALLKAAISLARDQGAKAVEGFPLTGERRHSKDTQVGFEALFAAQGFRVISRPSSSRALMRLDFG